MLKRIAVLGSGQGTNFQAIAEEAKCGKLPIDIRLVISDKREAFILKRAENFGIKGVFINPKKFSEREEFDKELEKELVKEKIDLVVLAGFMRIISPYLVRKFKWQILNIHPALLPSFKGVEGIKEALDYGVKITGVTVHFVDEGVDTGPIILQEAVKVEDEDNEETLAARIHTLEHRLYSEAIRLFVEGRLEIVGRRVKIKEDKPQTIDHRHQTLDYS